AFNAFLKTLEEPPPHVLFIFATTEPHKVLPTILSRCQRFDFRRITVPETVERLREITAAEGITADEQSLHLIARRGDGALRDALSIFDQAVSLCGDDLQYAALAEALGVVETDLYFEVTDGIAARDTSGLLRLVDGLARRGYDLQEFLAGLAEHVRGLYVAVSTGSADLVEADEATRARYLAAAEPLAEADLLRMLMVIDEAEREIKQSPQPRLKLELALLQLAALERTADLRALVEKLDRLERHIRSGDLQPLRASSEASSRAEPPARTAEPERPRYDPAPPHAEPTAEAPPAEEQPVKEPPAEAPPFDPDPPHGGPEAEPPSRSDEDSGEDGPPTPPSPPKPSPSRPEPPRPEPQADGLHLGLFGAPAIRKTDAPSDPSERGDGGSPRAEAVGVSVGVDEHFGVSLQRVREAWPRLVAALRAERPSVAGVLARVTPSGVEAGAVQVACATAFERGLLEDEKDAFAAAL